MTRMPHDETPPREEMGANAPSAEEAIGGPLTMVEAERDQALQQAAELKDRLMRTLAEMENLRKRMEREVADAKAYGMTGFARDMLAVADNLQRALDATASADLPADGPVRAFIDGVQLTQRELDKALEKNGVLKLEPRGEKFDPNLHQAVFEMPDEAIPVGHVAQVMQTGYSIGQRVLRPAMVGVSKGPTKAAPQG